MKPEKSIRIMHLLLMLTIILQLISEQLMEPPKPGEEIAQVEILFFSIHQAIGIVVLILAIVYLMIVMEKPAHKNRLFPWLDSELRGSLIRETMSELPGWLKGRLSHPDHAHLLAGTVHGLGLLLVTGLGASGSILYLGIESDGSMSRPIHTIKELHEILGTLMWIYLTGHLVMASWHQLKGHRVMQKIFFGNG